MTLSVQFTAMIVMVLSGLYLGLIQDTFRRFALYWKNRKAANYLFEISFWILQTLIIFYVLFLVNSGELRLYFILAFLLGFSAYQALFKTIYRRLLEVFIKLFKQFYSFFQRLVFIFIIVPVKWIAAMCIALLLFLVKVMIKTVQIILKAVLFPFYLLILAVKPFIPKKIISFFHKISMFYSTMKHISKKWLKYLTFKGR